MKAQRLQGRVSRAVQGVHGDSGLLREVPDLVEYPSVVAGTFAHEFLELPEEVLTTTLIHHQHFFPVEAEDGALKNAFLAVINTEPGDERTIARNAERVVTARLRDARFFWEADRKATLDSRIERLATLMFHKKLGTYKEKAERIERLAGWIAAQAFGAPPEAAAHAARAARLAKADLATDMVREFTELQGTMGGIYARHEGEPEEVWKAIYFHYLPVGVEADAPPTPAQLGKGVLTWAALSLADKLDTIVGLFAAGEKPTGSRDPYGLRRAAQAVMKILTDFATPSRGRGVDLGEMIGQAYTNFGEGRLATPESWEGPLNEFLIDRETHLLESRGFRADEIRAVVPQWWRRPQNARLRVRALAEARKSPDFEALAVLFKRVKNITKGFDGALDDERRARLAAPADQALLDEMSKRLPAIEASLTEESYGDAMRELGALNKPVDRFFTDVLVMTDDPLLREARLALLKKLSDTVLQTGGDISEIAAGGTVRLKPDTTYEQENQECRRSLSREKESRRPSLPASARSMSIFSGPGRPTAIGR